MPPTTNQTPIAGESHTSADDLLVAGALTLGIRLDLKDVAAFRIYREELVRWSERMNLTALGTRTQIVQQGFLDSLACTPLLTGDEARALDIGSGAGFPAIPIALTRPKLDFTLIEPSRKKLTFLRHLVRQLKLSRIRIRPGRAEGFSGEKSLLGAFDVAFARAVAPLPEVGQLLLPFLRPAGVFLAQVGPAEQSEDAVSRLLRIGFEMAGEIVVPAAFGKPGRRILALRKSGVP